MLEHIQPLPRAKRQIARDQRNRKACLSQCGSDMRRHVVRAFRGVTVTLLIFRYEALKEIAQIERDIGICVLLNDKRTRSVLDENGQKAAGDLLLSEPIFDRFGERIKTLTSGRNGKSGARKSQNLLTHPQAVAVRIRRRRGPTTRFDYSTVTLFARLRGWSTSHPRLTAM